MKVKVLDTQGASTCQETSELFHLSQECFVLFAISSALRLEGWIMRGQDAHLSGLVSAWSWMTDGTATVQGATLPPPGPPVLSSFYHRHFLNDPN
jgi:hypothetical protein